jgi:hypothetical protein
MDTLKLAQMKYGVRETSAFVGHSFSDADADIIKIFKEVISKLGLIPESGERPEAGSISAKIKARLEACEVFVGISPVSTHWGTVSIPHQLGLSTRRQWR